MKLFPDKALLDKVLLKEYKTPDSIVIDGITPLYAVVVDVGPACHESTKEMLKPGVIVAFDPNAAEWKGSFSSDNDVTTFYQVPERRIYAIMTKVSVE